MATRIQNKLYLDKKTTLIGVRLWEKDCFSYQSAQNERFSLIQEDHEDRSYSQLIPQLFWVPLKLTPQKQFC